MTAKTIWPLQRDMISFYGNPYTKGWTAANIVAVQCPWSFNGRALAKSKIEIHRKCAASLKSILGEIWDIGGHSMEFIHANRMDIFDGSFVIRNMRGSNSISTHAVGASLDWDARDNQFHSAQHFFTHDHVAVVKFTEAGWIWGGDWSPGSVDAMHFQAARVHA